jgi:hypothetical protein
MLAACGPSGSGNLVTEERDVEGTGGADLSNG